jgi:hypothetical protein
MPTFIKRHIITATIAISSATLLYAGMTFAREPQIRDDRVPQVAATASPDDKGGLRETEAPENEPEASDDNGNDFVAETAEPTESFDDHGGNGTDDGAGATASPDDHGGNGGGSDDASPTASPDDHGGSGGGSDDGPKATQAPSPSASPDDHGGHGSDG